MANGSVAFLPECLAPCLVERSPVQDHNEKIIRVSIPDLIQKAVHVLCVHFFRRHEVERPILGAHGRILIDEFAHQGQRNDRAEGSGSPTGTGVGHPSESGLVLKKKTDRRGVRSGYEVGCLSFGEFF